MIGAAWPWQTRANLLYGQGMQLALDQIALHPAGRAGGQRRDDDLVDRLGADRVQRRVEWVLVADLALTAGAEVVDELQRQIHADLGGVEDHVVVDDVAVTRPRPRHDDEEA